MGHQAWQQQGPLSILSTLFHPLFDGYSDLHAFDFSPSPAISVLGEQEPCLFLQLLRNKIHIHVIQKLSSIVHISQKVQVKFLKAVNINLDCKRYE